MNLSARKGEPRQIVETIRQRREDFLARPDVRPSAKAAVAEYADELLGKVASGEYPETRTEW